MAILWRCPYCKKGHVYEGNKICPKCGRDTTRTKNKTYYVEVSYYKDGKRHRLKRKVPYPNATLEEARRYEVELKEKLTRQPLTAKDAMRFSVFWEEEYIPHCKTTNSPSTVKRKQQIYTNWFKPYLGHLPLKSITRKTVEDFILWRLNQDNLSPRGGRPTPREIRHEITVLKHAFNCALRWGYLKENPAQKVELPKEEDRTKTWHILTEEEVQRLIDNMPIPQRYIIQFLFYTGLRFQDALNLRWDQVNLEKGYIHITIQKTQKALKLKLHRKAIEALKEALKLKKKNIPWVFYNPETQAPYTSLKRSFKSALKRAGLPNIRIHDLRHSFAVHALRHGVPIHVLKELLGHTQIATTEIYSKITYRDIEEAIEKLENPTPSLRLIEGQGA